MTFVPHSTQRLVSACFFTDGAFTECSWHTFTHLVITLTMGGRRSYSSCVKLRVFGVWNREVLLPTWPTHQEAGKKDIWLWLLQWPAHFQGLLGSAVGEGMEPQGRWLGQHAWEGHWALAPASEKAAVLAWAREKLWFLEIRISTFITVLSAKCKGGQRARDGSCYSWRNALMVKYEKCLRNEFPVMVWKQMLDSFLLLLFGFLQW